MNKRQKIILFCVTLLIITMIVLVLGNMKKWFYYVYPTSYPPYMEALLLSKVGIEEGELLEKDELEAFFQEFEGKFTGYYDTMPECVRKLTEKFVARINTRYLFELSPSQVKVYASSSLAGTNYILDFAFDNDDDNSGIEYYYAYREMKFAHKSLTHYLPKRIRAVDKNSGWLLLEVGFVSFSNDLSEIIRRVTQQDRTNPQNSSISVADYNEFMKGVIAGKMKIDDSLSFDYIRKAVKKSNNGSKNKHAE